MAATALRDAHGLSPAEIEIVPITTTGDRVKDVPVAEIGGKAVWTKELDEGLIAGRIDLSVHSMKDVETIRPAEFAIAAMLPRADVRDRLIGVRTLDDLAEGSRFGTSSPRRAAQMLHRRPDLEIVPLRGNVDTRLRKIAQGEADASLLAAAGLDRLGHGEIGVAQDDLLSAPAQGAVGMEVRADDKKLRALVAAVGDLATQDCVAAERRLLLGLGGTCHSPIAALARMEEGKIRLRAEILARDGRERVEGGLLFAPEDEEAPARLAVDLLSRASPSLRLLFGG